MCRKNIKEVKISSPYTQDKPKEKSVPMFLIVGGILIAILIVAYIVIALFIKKDNDKCYLHIISPNEFWSISRFLIIQI